MNDKSQVISSAQAAHVLTNPKEWRLLAPFMHGEKTLAQVARHLGMKLPTLSYHVGRYLDLGLLQVSREQARQGRAIKYYRTSANSFFVPFALTSSESLEQLLITMSTSLYEHALKETAHVLRNQADSWGVRVYADADGELSATLQPDTSQQGTLDDFSQSDFPALYLQDSMLQLDFESAKAFQKELGELQERYLKKKREGQQLYLVRLGLIPLRDSPI